MAVAAAIALSLVSFAPTAALAGEPADAAKTMEAVAAATGDLAAAQVESAGADQGADLLANGEAASLFLDTDAGQWYSTEGWLDYVVDNALIKGYDNGPNAGRFGPEDTLTRGQVATILWRVAGEPEVDSNGAPFVDVADTSAYYYEPVAWAAEQQIVTGRTENGVPTGYFDPDGLVLREELATMIGRYAAYIGDVDVDEDYTSVAFGRMPDATSVTGFARGWMAWCYDEGILTGDRMTGMITPQGSATRAQMAKMTAVLCDDVLNMPDYGTTQVQRENAFLAALKSAYGDTLGELEAMGIPSDLYLLPASSGIEHSYWLDLTVPLSKADTIAAIETNAVVAQQWSAIATSLGQMSLASYQAGVATNVDLPMYVRIFDNGGNEMLRIRNGVVELTIA